MVPARTAKQFIKAIAPIIKEQARAKGYKVVSPIIAQACCESRFGESLLSKKYHNYFGLKCGRYWKGASVNLRTKEEYTAGTLTSIRDNFRAYANMQEGVEGYFNFISTTRYANLKTADTPFTYLTRIKQDGYATSSSYITTNMRIVDTYNLTQYDDTPMEHKAPDMLDSLAREVIAGKWGNGSARKRRITQAGFNYHVVQKRVNELLKQ